MATQHEDAPPKLPVLPLLETPSRTVPIRYIFPDWPARVSISILCSSNLNSSPQMVVRVLNRLSSRAIYPQDNFSHVHPAGCEAVKRMLQDGTASVFDILVPVGISLLNKVMHGFHLPMVQLLLSAGADPYQEPLYSSGADMSAMTTP